jgi:hypothetical protein
MPPEYGIDGDVRTIVNLRPSARVLEPRDILRHPTLESWSRFAQHVLTCEYRTFLA